VQTGIGRWSEEAFVRAMRAGVDRAGRHLYPAFPYDHFARTDAADLRALYAYFMTREPVQARAPANALYFPFNLRPLIAVWKWLFLRDAPAATDAALSPEFNRGAYLVQGIAHCGGCHTPRNFLGAEKRGEALAGGTIEGWHAPALTAASPSPKPWTAGELYLYLRYGTVPEHAIPAGPMRPVVHNLALADDEDVRAIAVYVGGLMSAIDPGERERLLDTLLARARGSGAPAGPPAPAHGEKAILALGAELYAGACASCHARGRSPATSGEAQLLPFGVALRLDTPANLLRIVVDGIEPGPEGPGRFMPSFAGAFTAEQLAALVAYLRAAFTAEPAWRSLRAEVRAVLRERRAH
jgi:mono/diheme cytochrome c family protein